jgi:iron complex transport system substrate-binding protein
MTSVHRRARGLRWPAALILLILSLLVATACGEDEPDTAAAPAETTAQSAAQFPVTIEHKYGSTEIAEAPKRIFTAGYNEQDSLWALGVAPVGVTDWMGFEHGIGPWAEEAAAAAGEKPELVRDLDGIQYEKIAALQPDVIVALYTDLTKAEYDKLSQIAPTVAQPEGVADWGIAWQDSVTTIGKVVGKPDEAKEVIADLDERIAEEKEAHPEFQGKKASFAMAFEGIWAYGESDPRSRLLQALGFELSQPLVDLVGDTFSKKLSNERADLLDLDTVAWIGSKADKEQLDDNRVYTRLPVRQEGRDFFIEAERPDKAMNAIGFQSPLSIAQSLDVLVPAFAAALDDDPDTKPLEG